jgi:2-(1,2-epoxy-1,2-dihydrophenyl)acetyl-CoA isomerase
MTMDDLMSETQAPALSIRHDGWIEIVLNRPETANAFNDEMHCLLLRFMRDAAEDDSCRAVLLTGAGRHFCSGQDLRDRDPRGACAPMDLSRSLKERYNPLVRTIRNMPKPVICALNGPVAGAGIGLALTCDIVIGAESAIFSFAFAKVGLVPDAGASWHLSRLLGEARAKYLLMTAARMTALEARILGLIAEVVADDRLDQDARTLTAQLAAGPTAGLALMKKAIATAAAIGFDEQLDVEMELQGIAGRTGDYAEGVMAFLERRQPHFLGE